MNTVIGLKGRYVLEHFRDGKKIGQYDFHNDIVNQGKNSLLNIMFDTATQITSWFVGLIDSAGYTALAAGDTYQNINQAGNQWSEFTGYTDGNNADNVSTRPAWGVGGATGQAITNGSPMVYNITAPGTVAGVFAVGGATGTPHNKSDHGAGPVLWSTALMGSPVPVAVSDQLKVTYVVNC